MDVVSLKCCDNVICFNRYWTVTGNSTPCVLPTEVSYKMYELFVSTVALIMLTLVVYNATI